MKNEEKQPECWTCGKKTPRDADYRFCGRDCEDDYDELIEELHGEA